MILVDTSVWVDHLRSGNERLGAMLQAGQILAHPFVVGELALGHLRQRSSVLDALLNLPQAIVASDAETRHFIDRHRLFGRGIGYIDAHLLAAAQLTQDARFWTTDKRLHDVANTLGLAIAS
ncbi:MAG: type II toxin-antitoxin system VapC family toxin [Rhodopila sp.]